MFFFFLRIFFFFLCKIILANIGKVLFTKSSEKRAISMDILTNKGKKQIIKKHSPRSPLAKNCTLSFIFGGTICLLGELLFMLYFYLTQDKKLSGILVTVSVIFLASLLTAVGVFDKIARAAGAGTLVPVSGFSNALTSAAIDSRSEGMVLGVGSKLFLVAGPVIVWGLVAGVLYGVIYFSLILFGVV